MKLQKQNPIWYFTGNEYFCGGRNALTWMKQAFAEVKRRMNEVRFFIYTPYPSPLDLTDTSPKKIQRNKMLHYP